MSLLNISTKNTAAMYDFMEGRRRGILSFLLFAGPALIAAIAYVDPGNYATNIEAGSKYGYSLLWIVLLANLIAMLFQSMSARLGIVTSKNLAEVCRDNFKPVLTIPMWIISEISAMATDLAEFIGGAIGFSLLFHLPLMVGMFIVALLTYAILILERYGYRTIEITIGAFVIAICMCYLLELFIAPVDWMSVGLHCFKPEMPNTEALFISVGIIGATIMPHAIYLHSGLMPIRTDGVDNRQKKKLIKYSNIEVIIALSMAGIVNMAMVIMASSAFYNSGHVVTEIEDAYNSLRPLLGGAAASLYLFSLLMSGVSSSVVGTMAGQIIMQGFVGFRIPLWLRRLITIVPAFIVVAMGLNATNSLVASQVVLSISLPIPMIALCYFTSSKKIMGQFVNNRLLNIFAIAATVLILFLNFVLIYQSIFGV